MDKNEFTLKRIQTDIKSAQGAMAMSLILTLIYIIKAIFSKNLNFYFSFFTNKKTINKTSAKECFNNTFAFK